MSELEESLKNVETRPSTDLRDLEPPGTALGPRLRQFVSEFRDTLSRSPGNEELDARFDWEHAKRVVSNKLEEQGLAHAVFVPATTAGKSDLVLPLHDKLVHEICGHSDAVGCAVDFGQTIVLPLTLGYRDYLFTLADLKSEYPPLKSEPISSTDQDAFRESLVLHELTHSDKRGSEFQAYRAQYDYLEERGVIGHVPDKDIMSKAFAHDPRSYAKSVADISADNLEALQRWSPGGKEFEQFVGDLKAEFRKLAPNLSPEDRGQVEHKLTICTEADIHQTGPYADYYFKSLEGELQLRGFAAKTIIRSLRPMSE